MHFPPRPLGAAAPLLCGRQVRRPRLFPSRCSGGLGERAGDLGKERRAGGGVGGARGRNAGEGRELSEAHVEDAERGEGKTATARNRRWLTECLGEGRGEQRELRCLAGRGAGEGGN